MYFGSGQEFGFLPPGVQGDVQAFFSNAQVNTYWQQWTKPRGVQMVFIVCIGGGGGGGGGTTGASTTARGGGGGGACSGLTTMLVPAFCLPDILKVSVGNGGIGGIPGGSGGAATNSFVAAGNGTNNGSVIPNLICLANASFPTGGNGGTTSNGGAGGTASGIATKAGLGWMGGYAIITQTVGIGGSAGGAQTGVPGTTISTTWNTIPLSPGSGGAGVNAVNTGFAGGPINLSANMDLPDGLVTNVLGGLAGSASAAGNGNPGYQNFKPLLMTGGSGGGSSDGSNGGNGGNGGIGCGGGGGGAGVTAGRGGNGGDGLVLIVSW